VELPLEGVAPGAYLARATVRAHGEVVAERAREVEVRPLATGSDLLQKHGR
jgi:hypothetical protein